MNPPLRNFPLGIRLLLMFCLFLFNMLVITGLSLLFLPTLFGIDRPESVIENIPQTITEANAFLFIQSFSTLGGFLLTAIMFARLEANNVSERLKIGSVPSLKMLVLVVISVLLAQFFIQFLVDLNSKIPLPDALGFFKDYDARNEAMINAVLNFKQFRQFLILTLVMALIPALSEEMFFRGLLLGAFLRERMNPFVAIVLSGFIFAVSHMEYQNTIAIWALGIFLGYLYYISGNIWLSFAAHFTNNFLMVIFKYLYNIGIIGKDIADATMPLWVTVISVLLFSVSIYIFNRWKQPQESLELSNFENG